LSQTWQRNSFMDALGRDERPETRKAPNRSREIGRSLRSGLESASSTAKREPFKGDRPYWSGAMRVKLFSQGLTAPIQSLEDDINEFLESQRPHVTYVSVTSSDVERVASVWYEEPHHRTVEQTMAELEELVEEPGGEGNLA
jgi:hypothetical protein